jgi:hypothetical protein
MTGHNRTRPVKLCSHRLPARSWCLWSQILWCSELSRSIFAPHRGQRLSRHRMPCRCASLISHLGQIQYLPVRTLVVSLFCRCHGWPPNANGASRCYTSSIGPCNWPGRGRTTHPRSDDCRRRPNAEHFSPSGKAEEVAGIAQNSQLALLDTGPGGREDPGRGFWCPSARQTSAGVTGASPALPLPGGSRPD